MTPKISLKFYIKDEQLAKEIQRCRQRMFVYKKKLIDQGFLTEEQKILEQQHKQTLQELLNKKQQNQKFSTKEERNKFYHQQRYLLEKQHKMNE